MRNTFKPSAKKNHRQMHIVPSVLGGNTLQRRLERQSWRGTDGEAELERHRWGGRGGEAETRRRRREGGEEKEE